MPEPSSRRDSLFLPFHWPRTRTTQTVSSSATLPRSTQTSIPQATQTSPTLSSVEQPLNLTATSVSEASSNMTTISLPKGTILKISKAKSPVASTSLDTYAEELPISRLRNPRSSPFIDVVELSPQRSSTIDIVPVEAIEVPPSPSSDHS
jgi:hypothetical protein